MTRCVKANLTMQLKMYVEIWKETVTMEAACAVTTFPG